MRSQTPCFIGLFLILLASFVSCSPSQICNQGVSNLSLDPQGSPCKTICDCSNQKFEGVCNSGVCISRIREDCGTSGQQELCLPLPSTTGACRQGVKRCGPDYLSGGGTARYSRSQKRESAARMARTTTAMARSTRRTPIVPSCKVAPLANRAHATRGIPPS